MLAPMKFTVVHQLKNNRNIFVNDMTRNWDNSASQSSFFRTLGRRLKNLNNPSFMGRLITPLIMFHPETNNLKN